jgi:threonine/homoserine/homoserine lactone efflux protein
MPENINIAAFIVGAILLLVALTTGGVTIFGSSVGQATSKRARYVAGLLGFALLAYGAWLSIPERTPEKPKDSEQCKTLPVEDRPLHCLEIEDKT